jgi:plastocyanin
LISTIVYAVCAALVATGWRWAMLFPLAFCSLDIIAGFSSGFPEYSLTHPSAEYVAFVLLVIIYPTLLAVILAAAVKLAQTVRHQPSALPEWMKPALGLAAGLTLGALLIGVNVRAPAAGGSAAGKAGTQTVHLAAATFAPDIIALHKGDTLTIVDDTPVPHILANGTWSSDSKPVPGEEPDAPTVNNVEVNGNSAIIGPFTTSGTYHIYCTVHPGMSLTIIVQ